MRYVRADIQQVNRSEWRGYVEEFQILFSGTTKALAQQECHEAITSEQGLSEFQIIWSQC